MSRTGGRYQRALPREPGVDPRKYTIGRLLTFRGYMADSIPSWLLRGDVVRVAFRCTNGVTGGINVVRVRDGRGTFVFPEEVTVRRRRR